MQTGQAPLGSASRGLCGKRRRIRGAVQKKNRQGLRRV